jgi:hypothetical protein
MRILGTGGPKRQRQRGAALATVGVTMMVILGMAVLGVDVGRLALTAGETQVAVDVASVAYARRMLRNEIDGGFEDPHSYANGVLKENWIDGREATMANVEYAVGRFDFESRVFRPGGFPANAVRAEGRADVDNIVAGIFGDPTSSVNRFAVAAYGGASSVQPTLPIALGDCYFKKFQRSDDCSDLPVLQQVPDNEDNSCWTSLSAYAASASEATSMLPEQCCSGGNCGGGDLPPPLAVGDDIDVLNGQANTLMRVLADCVRQGLTEFVIPIVECGKCNQAMEVVGFATIDIADVRTQGGRKGIELASICNSDVSGMGGGTNGNFGTMTVSLVQ